MEPDSGYEARARAELAAWSEQMQARPGLLAGISRQIQGKLNRIIPEAVHRAVTSAFRVATGFLLRGADFLTTEPLSSGSLQEREREVRRQLERYKNAAMAEGAITGAGGILLGLADLPLWLSIKVKMLTHIAALYGHDPGDYRERLYILYILSLTFSSRRHRRRVYRIILNWDAYVRSLPERGDTFDWRSFQQEYRDFLDLAKLLQLVPGIGAAVGAVVNNRLTDRLGTAAMNAYRLRWFGELPAADAGGAPMPLSA